MTEELQNIIENKDQYDKESQDFLTSISFAKQEIGQLEEMKKSSGWQLLDKKIREELHQRITDLVKDDLKIQTLLALLVVADTKTLSQTLQEEIDKILPKN